MNYYNGGTNNKKTAGSQKQKQKQTNSRQQSLGRSETEDEQLNRLRAEKQECIARAKRLEKGQDKVWKQEIRLLAEVIEKELVLLGQEWYISQISEEIARIYRRNEIRIWSDVHKFLSAKYKNGNVTQESYSISGDASRGVPEHSSYTESLYAVTHNIGLIPKTEVAEAFKIAKQIEQQCKKRAELEHVALLPNDNSSFVDQINEGKEDERVHVTIDKPRPHGSLTYDALTVSIEKLTKVRDRVFEFPPEILEKDQEIAAGWETWNTWMSPALDLKYSKSWLDWFRTEKYRDVYGKHAASVMSFSLTNLCSNCSDEKTKEWIRMEPVAARNYSTYRCLRCNYRLDTVCPKCNVSMKQQEKEIVSWECPECNNTTPLRRDLTREQVGDKSSIIIDAAIQVLDHIPSQVAFCAWYSDWIEPKVASRKERLSDDLSDKA